MYRIRGSDQKEYGPISADQLRQWIAQNRVDGRTLLQAEGGADWRPLAGVAEFADALRNRPAAAMLAAAGLPVRTSGLAIASLVLGCLGFCFINPILGVIFGIVAQRKIKLSNGQLTGSGLALAGIIVSVVLFIPSLAITAAFFLPALAAGKAKAQTINCVNHMKQLALAVRVYANDHDDHYPPAATWCDAIKPSVGQDQIFKCPVGEPGQQSHYAFNARLSGLEDKIDPNTVLLFEIDGGWNVSGGPDLLRRLSRHGRTYVVAFADGHVDQVSILRLSQLRWDP